MMSAHKILIQISELGFNFYQSPTEVKIVWKYFDPKHILCCNIFHSVFYADCTNFKQSTKMEWSQPKLTFSWKSKRLVCFWINIMARIWNSFWKISILRDCIWPLKWNSKIANPATKKLKIRTTNQKNLKKQSMRILN